MRDFVAVDRVANTMYWSISTECFNYREVSLFDARNQLRELVKERGINPLMVDGLFYRAGKKDHMVWSLTLLVTSEPNGSCTARAIIYWEGRTSRSKAYPVAWA